ncbi:MAG: flagellar hook-basal body complex protein FliE [Rickettsiaceae bacterium]|nr:flagellar hook-basal body complex protein FliE [Rickettsiaceae bacterium]
MSDSVNFPIGIAANIYKQASNNVQITQNGASAVGQIEFQSLLQNTAKANFNSFINLTPKEILDRISLSKAAQNVVNNSFGSVFASNAIKSLDNVRSTLKAQERAASKAAIGDANLVELMTANTKATSLLSAIVAIKDEAKAAWEKIWSMSL